MSSFYANYRRESSESGPDSRNNFFFYFEVAFLGFLEMGASSSGNENADHVTGYANEYANEPEDSHPIFWLLCALKSVVL